VALLIFDLDGTLIDSKADLASAVNATRAEMNLGPLSLEDVGSYVGDGAPMLIRRALPSETPQDEIDKSLEFFLGYYRRHALDETVLYPGIDASLRRLHAASHKLAVLTNKPVRVSKAILEGLGVAPLFVHGRNAGVKACGVKWGFRPETLEEARPDLLVNTMAEFEKAIE
jgi:phosphoglycolate phosphatase